MAIGINLGDDSDDSLNDCRVKRDEECKGLYPKKKKKYLSEKELHKYLLSKGFKRDIMKQIEKDTWDKGLPKIYLNDQGDMIKHFKSGKKVIILTKKELSLLNKPGVHSNYFATEL